MAIATALYSNAVSRFTGLLKRDMERNFSMQLPASRELPRFSERENPHCKKIMNFTQRINVLLEDVFVVKMTE